MARHPARSRRPFGPQKNSIKKAPRKAPFQNQQPNRFVSSAGRIVAETRIGQSCRRFARSTGLKGGHDLLNEGNCGRCCRAQSCLSRRCDVAKSCRELRICNGESTDRLDKRKKEPVLCRTRRHRADFISEALCLDSAIARAGREARNCARGRRGLCICERNGSAKRKTRDQQRPFKHN